MWLGSMTWQTSVHPSVHRSIPSDGSKSPPNPSLSREPHPRQQALLSLVLTLALHSSLAAATSDARSWLPLLPPTSPPELLPSPPSLTSPHLIEREEGDHAREQVRRRRRLPDPQGLGPGAPTTWQQRQLWLTGPPWAWTWSSVSSMGSASRSAPPWVGPGAPSPWRVGCIPTSASARPTTPSARASAARIGDVSSIDLLFSPLPYVMCLPSSRRCTDHGRPESSR